MLLSLLLALVQPAHAIAALRLGGGAGTSNVGPAVRFGLDTEVWLTKRVGVGGRAAAGVNGGEPLLILEPAVAFRVVGGKLLSLVVEPGLGLAMLPASGGTMGSASVFTGIQSNILLLSLSAGPRFETLGFKQNAVTLNVGIGIAI